MKYSNKILDMYEAYEKYGERPDWDPNTEEFMLGIIESEVCDEICNATGKLVVSWGELKDWEQDVIQQLKDKELQRVVSSEQRNG